MECLLASDRQVFQTIIQNCDNFLFDCDGVLWHATEVIEGAVDVVNQLHKLGKKVLYITNNSTKTREQYVEKLSSLGFAATKNDIFGTAYTSALYLKNELKIQGKVYVVGNESMAKELDNLGINYFGIGPDNSVIHQSEVSNCKFEDGVEAVLVGFDGNISFTKMLKAATYINDPNCVYVATNDDHRMPMKNSNVIIPGTGCIVNSVTTAAGKLPDVLCGKPGTYMFKCIQEKLKLDPQRSIMIGDRMNTDILFGTRNKLKTMVVFTGITSKESLDEACKSNDTELKEQVPNYYLPSISLWAPMFSTLK